VQPHQTFLRLHDPVSGEDGVLPVRVTPGGKAKLELVRAPIHLQRWNADAHRQNMGRPPAGLPPTPAGAGPLRATLLLGSFVHAPAALPLFELVLPASAPAPVSDEDAEFRPRPEIAHVFRAPQALPPALVSGGFAGLVLAPWLALAFLVRSLPLFPGRYTAADAWADSGTRPG
jgi:oligosaccharyltransferase complex subunit delta (ribophorin II)